MPWVRLDENFPHHPKLVEAGPVAAWLWACGLAYCNRYLTDGRIPAGALWGLGVSPDHDPGALAARLVAVGMWDLDGDGWVVHDYLEFQPSRAEVQEQRERASEAGRKGAASRWGKGPGALAARRTDGEPHGTGHSPRQADPMAYGSAACDGPSRPVGVSSSLVGSSTFPESVGGPGGTVSAPATPRSKRGSRLPEPWPLTADLRAQALAANARCDPELEHARFGDYWRAKPGAAGCKLDWVATWRNWCRNARTGNGNGRPTRGLSRTETDAVVDAVFGRRPDVIDVRPVERT